jgi:hypothetical protein
MGAFCLFGGVHDVSGDRHARVFGNECGEVFVGDKPVWAIVEVQQGHIHVRMVNLATRLEAHRDNPV